VDLAAAQIAVRFALYLDLMLVFGFPLFSLYTWRGGQQQGDGEAISAGTLFALLLSGAALSVVGMLILAAAMSDVAIFQLNRDTLYALLDGTAIGTAGKIRIAALVVALPISVWPTMRPRVRWAIQSCLGAVALGSLAWTGHGAADEGLGGVGHLAADIVHLLAAGIWLGALVGLLGLVLRTLVESSDRQARVVLAHRALAGFSSVGAVSVGLIILTGLVNSWFLVGVGNVASLAVSDYGRLLLLKLLVFAGMIGLAGLNRFKLTPAISKTLGEASAAKAMRSIGQSVALEASLALAVLALVAWLGTLAPPSSA